MKHILTMALVAISLASRSQCNTAAPVVYNISQTSSPGEIYRPNGSNWKGGDTIKITGGNYTVIEFNNVGGDACRPLIIMPSDTTKTTYFRLKNGCHHIKVFGGTKQYGLNVGVFSADRWKSIKIENVRTNMFLLKTQPEYADQSTWYGNFPTSDSLEVSNCLVFDSDGESFYVGHTESAGNGFTVQRVPGNPAYGDTTIHPQPISNVNIHHNVILNAGWDGIQLDYCLGKGNKIMYNTVIGYGAKNISSQQGGILVGGSVRYCEVAYNTVRRGTGNGIQVFGKDTTYVHDNVIDSCGYNGTSNGQDAVFVNDNLASSYESFPAPRLIFTNNAILNPAPRGAIRFNNQNGTTLPATITNNRFCLRSNETISGMIINPISGSTVSGNYLQCVAQATGLQIILLSTRQL